MIAPTKLPSMSEAEARDLTTRINSTAGDLCLLLVEAHDRQAWRSLGYESWRAYATSELNVSRATSYRVLDHGRVTLALLGAIADGGGEVSQVETPARLVSDTAAREIKPVLSAVVADVTDRVERGAAPREAIKEAVAAHRPPSPPKPAAEPPSPPAEEPDDEYGDELAEAQREIERLQKENESLRTDDAGAEIRKLSALRAQEQANNLAHQRRIAALEEVIRKRDSLLNRIRKTLGIDRDGDFIAAIEALKQ